MNPRELLQIHVDRTQGYMLDFNAVNKLSVRGIIDTEISPISITELPGTFVVAVGEIARTKNYEQIVKAFKEQGFTVIRS